jgi:hypothetical protein
MIESLQKFDYYYRDDLKVDMPESDGPEPLWDVAGDLSRRLIRLFTRDETGNRPVFDREPLFQDDPDWTRYPLFYEFFHADTGAGVGASHQTGWTALVAKLIQQSGGAPDGR